QLTVETVAVIENALFDQLPTLSSAVFSTSRAMGAAYVAPYPTFSTTTATATRGWAAGAKATNHECERPDGLVAVPVLPATVTCRNCAGVPVPRCTTATIMAVTFAAVCADTGFASVAVAETVAGTPSRTTWRTMYGRGSFPPLAIVAPSK